LLKGITAGVAALNLGRLRLEASARNTANLNTPGASRVRVLARETPQGGVVPQVDVPAAAPDLITESVEQVSASRQVSLLKKALQIQEEMVGMLLDLRA